MKRIFKNIIILSLIITAFNLLSCSDVSKSCCEEILNFSYTESDSIVNYNIDLAERCSEKYHKRPEFLQKISQIYYYDAINNYTSNEQSTVDLLQLTKKLYLALEYMNSYMSRIDVIKSYDYQFRGEIYERLGDIYNDINSLKPAAELYDKALSDYKSADSNEKYLNSLIKIGKLYQYNHIPNIAMIYFEMAEENKDIPNNIYRKIIDNKIVTLYELNDYKNADSIFKNHFNVKVQNHDFHSAVGTKYFYERNYKEALPHLKYCFENGNLQEKLIVSEKLAETYFNLDDHDNEMIYIQYQAKYNSIEIRRTPLKLDLEKLFDTYYTIVINDKTVDNNNNIATIVIILIISLIIISLITITFSKSKKKDQEKISTAQKTISANNEIIESKDKIINDISKKLTDIETNENYEEAYKRFVECDIITKIRSSFDGITIMTKNVQNHSKLQLSSKDTITLIKTFNNCFPKAISSMKNDFEGITPNDIRFIILTFINLNNAEIAVLLGLTYGAANKRSNKIKNIFNIKDDLNQFLYSYIKSKF